MNGNVVRHEKDKNYTVIYNSFLHDTNLSLKSKGLLTVMLSLPSTWDYSIRGLCTICNESEYSIKQCIDDLTTHGYMKITRVPPTVESHGRFTYKYCIYEEPFFADTRG